MNRQGFSLIEVAVAVIVVAIIAATAYLYFNRPSDPETADNTPATYQSDQDLEVAANELESTDVDAELDGLLQELDQEAAAF